jgi:hypothetical protein
MSVIALDVPLTGTAESIRTRRIDMKKPSTTFVIALVLVSFTGCSLAAHPIPEVAVTPSPSTEDSLACDRAAYDAGKSRPPIMSRWLIIPEVIFWPISEVVFLPLMVAMSHNPSDSDRAQLDTYKEPYTKCLLTKGYKTQ